jgi:hypothetical protein
MAALYEDNYQRCALKKVTPSRDWLTPLTYNRNKYLRPKPSSLGPHSSEFYSSHTYALHSPFAFIAFHKHAVITITARSTSTLYSTPSFNIPGPHGLSGPQCQRVDGAEHELVVGEEVCQSEAREEVYQLEVGEEACSSEAVVAFSKTLSQHASGNRPSLLNGRERALGGAVRCGRRVESPLRGIYDVSL